MVTVTGLAETAALIGDPARAAMLMSLLDGRALTAGELAHAGGVAPATASGHLARLLDAGMIAVVPQGRHRYFRLANGEIAASLEAMMVTTAHRIEASQRRPIRTGPRDLALRDARLCYDHLAGRIGVALFDAMVTRGLLHLAADGARLTGQGTQCLSELGVADAGAAATMACRPCLDWSERRPHLAGPAGAALCTLALGRGWVRRTDGSRAVTVTPAGVTAFARHFGVGDRQSR